MGSDEFRALVATEPEVHTEEFPLIPGPGVAQRSLDRRKEVELSRFDYILVYVGCQYTAAGLLPVAHNQTCRERIEKPMMEDDKLRERAAAHVAGDHRCSIDTSGSGDSNTHKDR